MLIRQYRYAAQKKLWEIVAGRIDPGETPLQAARRELAEEGSLAAKKWEKLGVFYPSPGFMDEKMWIYLAQGLTPSSAVCDPDERIECKWFTRAEVHQMIAKNQIVDAKTVLAVCLSD